MRIHNTESSRPKRSQNAARYDGNPSACDSVNVWNLSHLMARNKGQLEGALAQMEFLTEHAREVALLCGPNGDPCFVSRLERSIKKTCDTARHAGTGKRSGAEYDLLAAYVTGGTIYVTRELARRGADLSSEDYERLCAAIIRANDALLGTARG